MYEVKLTNHGNYAVINREELCIFDLDSGTVMEEDNPALYILYGNRFEDMRTAFNDADKLNARENDRFNVLMEKDFRYLSKLIRKYKRALYNKAFVKLNPITVNNMRQDLDILNLVMDFKLGDNLLYDTSKRGI